MPKRRGITDWIFASFCVVLSVALFLVPGFRLAEDLRDPALRNGAIPRAAWRLHENLAPRYAAWAGQRIASQRAARLDNSNVADTEWPLFGSVFYLLALESLQDAWRADPTLAPVAPNVLAHDAIESSVDLVLDPNHATWVKQKYGASYLDKDDLFYRFLRIAAMTSYSRLTGNPRLLETLRRETASLGAEVDRSPAGLLEDYPGECYPTDVLGAIAAIARADKVLALDPSAFVVRAQRAFDATKAGAWGLPSYRANAATGAPQMEPRGCGLSYALIFAPELWPQRAQDWARAYQQHYWQSRSGLAGFREFSDDRPDSAAFADVDSGPVILGFGTAASAFGVGAARVNGRMDEAAPLTGEMLACSWTLTDGTLLLPRALAWGTDAPYLGEAGILFCLTRQPIAGIQGPATTVMTPFTWVLLAWYLCVGAWLLTPMIRLLLPFAKRSAGRA